MNKTRLTLLSSIIGATCLSAAPNALAQEYSPVLQEILITSQKREQTLNEVPVSVSVLGGEKLDDSAVPGIERMADLVPGLTMSQTGIGTTVAIRGISSGVNQGFEQSAALFVDGVHFGRAQLTRAPFLDIERVEVLRGPQGILLGKNSTAGAISIITAQPTETFSGKASLLYEPNHGEQDLRLVVSGPLYDNLYGRLAILDRSMDGWFENTTLDRDETQERAQVFRGTLNWQPTDTWDITLKLEDGSFDNKGRNIDVVWPTTLPVAGAVDYANVLALLTGGEYQLETRQNFRRQSNGDYSNNDTRHGVLTVGTVLGEFDVTSVTGYNSYSYDELCDCDFIGLPLLYIHSEESYRQWSQEFRLASPEQERISYIAGVFGQTHTLEFNDATGVPEDSLLPTILAANGVQGTELLAGTSSDRDFRQDGDLAALFGELTWNITDVTRLIVGARYTWEQKTASRRQYHVDTDGSEVPLGTPGDTLNVIYGLFNIEPYDTIERKRTESNLTPLLTLQHDLNATDMLYARFTTGVKSGGFDVRSNAHPDPAVNNAFNFGNDQPRPIVGVFEFEDERATNYELGGKFELARGAAELQVALFRSEFTDLQTSQFDGAFSFNVTNAAKAHIHGLELDGRWALADNVTLSGGFTWLDFEYRDFPNAQCYFGQQEGVTSAEANLCDASGQTREFTPRWQGNLSSDYRLPLTRGLSLNSTVDIIFSDSYLTAPTLDPRTKQSAYTKLNARIALSGPDRSWELALIGNNLTDEAIVSYSNGLPLSTVLTGGTGTAYYAFYERPRSIALQGSVRF